MIDYIFEPPEILLRAHLNAAQDVPVFINAPDKLPERFVQVQRVGGVAALVTDRPMVTFTCWAPSRTDAARLAETIRAHVRRCRSLAGLPVYRVREIGGPAYRPDPDKNTPRYQFTLELQVRGKQFAP